METDNRKRENIIKHIVVCSSGFNQTMSIDELQRYWRLEKGITTPIYHYVIKANGDRVQLAALSKAAGTGKTRTRNCIYICYMGGISKHGKPIDNRTKAQEESMFELLVELSHQYKRAKIVGLRDVSDTNEDSPCFDVRTWLSEYIPIELLVSQEDED